MLAQGVDIGKTFGSPFGTTNTLGDLVSIIVTGSVTIAGIIVFFLFLFGGLKIIAGAGSDNPQSTAQGKQAVTAAVAGFIIVFTAFWIVRAIEFLTGNTFFLTGPFLSG